MTASPAQVANDLAAQARFWDGRDRHVENVCRDAADAIRKMLAGEQLDGRTWHGLHRRLLDQEARFRSSASTTIWRSLTRGRLTLEALRNGVTP